MPKRLARHIGNRGTVLALLGVIWVLTGIGLVTEPERRTGLLDEHFPLEVRAGIWLVPGVVAVVASLWRRLDPLAWGLLIAPLALRAALLMFAWLFEDNSTAWRAILVYLAFGILLNRCAAGLDRPSTWDGRERRWTPGR